MEDVDDAVKGVGAVLDVIDKAGVDLNSKQKFGRLARRICDRGPVARGILEPMSWLVSRQRACRERYQSIGSAPTMTAARRRTRQAPGLCLRSSWWGPGTAGHSSDQPHGTSHSGHHRRTK